MLRLLCPRMMFNTVLEVDADRLRRQGIGGVVLDLDNTLLPWGGEAIAPEVSVWLRGLLAANMKAGFVSNNHTSRVSALAAQFAIPYAARALKPSGRGFRQVMAAMQLPPEQVAVIGDQLFTDILGGNRLGCWTIWVKPLSNHEFIGTKITRQLEAVAVRLLRAKNMI
ncbi:MAG: YqeG family HAD IIIA-type phosphatase [Sporomusaceae bacterium]|nr:YqeG family HAD IIIA-type phosphatase [Sporomusaceae bacterium]